MCLGPTGSGLVAKPEGRGQLPKSVLGKRSPQEGGENVQITNTRPRCILPTVRGSALAAAHLGGGRLSSCHPTGEELGAGGGQPENTSAPAAGEGASLWQAEGGWDRSGRMFG